VEPGAASNFRRLIRPVYALLHALSARKNTNQLSNLITNIYILNPHMIPISKQEKLNNVGMFMCTVSLIGQIQLNTGTDTSQTRSEAPGI
jgi:hypothetical protein